MGELDHSIGRLVTLVLNLWVLLPLAVGPLMYKVKEFMGGSSFGGLRLLGGRHFAGSSYARCCLALTSVQVKQVRPSLTFMFLNFHRPLGLQKLRELLNNNVQICLT